MTCRRVTRALCRWAMQATYGAMPQFCSEKSMGKRMCWKLGILFTSHAITLERHSSRGALRVFHFGNGRRDDCRRLPGNDPENAVVQGCLHFARIDLRG